MSNKTETTLASVTAAATGAISSEPTELLGAGGRLLQAVVRRSFVRQLEQEYRNFEEKGRIKDDFKESKQARACLSEVLKELEELAPDEDRLEAMKKIYLAAALETISDRNSPLPQQFMQLCRTLSSGEILVLCTTATASLDQSVSPSSVNSAIDWLRFIAERSGLKHTELVQTHESGLIEKGLLSRRTFGDKSGVNLGNRLRLTGLGGSLCDFIAVYEKQTTDD